MQRGGAGRDGCRVGGADGVRDRALELVDLRPHREVPGAHDLLDRRELRVPDVRPRKPDRVGHAVARASPDTTRSSARAPRRGRPWLRSRAARAPSRCSECGARRRCSGAAGRDLPRAARQALHPLGEIVDRDRRARVSDVEALPDRVLVLEGEERAVDHVVHVAPRTDLRAVAVNREVASRQRGLDERANGPAADLTGAVHVERTYRDRRQAELGVVGVCHVLTCELRDGVGPARLADGADRRHVGLVHVERVLAEHLARREVDEPFEVPRARSAASSTL